MLRREPRIVQDGREQLRGARALAELLVQNRLPHARFGTRIVVCQRGVLLERPLRRPVFLERTGVDEMAVSGAEAGILLAQVVERHDRGGVVARGELRYAKSEQDLRVVLEQAGARFGADADGFRVPAGSSELAGEPRRGLDVLAALVVQRALAHAAIRIHGVLCALERASRRRALPQRRQHFDDQVGEATHHRQKDDEEQPAHVAARAQQVHDGDHLDRDRENH